PSRQARCDGMVAPRGERIGGRAFALERAPPHQVEPKTLRKALVVADHDVVEDRQWQRQARALAGARDAAEIYGARTGVGDVWAGEAHLSPVGGVDAGDHVEQGRLARTVGTDEAENFVLRA